MARSKNNDIFTAEQVVEEKPEIATKVNMVIPEEQILVEPEIKDSIKVEPPKVETKKEEVKPVEAKKKYHGQVMALCGDSAFVQIPHNTVLVKVNNVKVGDWIDF